MISEPSNLNDPGKHQHGLSSLCCPRSSSPSLRPPGWENLAPGYQPGVGTGQEEDSSLCLLETEAPNCPQRTGVTDKKTWNAFKL